MGMTIQAGAGPRGVHERDPLAPRLRCYATRRFGRHLRRSRPAPARHAAAQRPWPWSAGCSARPPISASSCAPRPPRCACSKATAAVRGAVLATPEGETTVRATPRRRARHRRLRPRPRAPARAVSRPTGPALDRRGPLGHRRRPAPRRSRPAAASTTRSPRRAPGARSRWCPSPTAPPAASRTSSSAASPASSASSPTAGASATRATATTTTSPRCCARCRPGQEVASWLVCTPRLPAPLRPRHLPADARCRSARAIRSGYLKTGRTIAELARACGIDPDGPRADARRLQPPRPRRRGPRLRPRPHALQPPTRATPATGPIPASHRSSAGRSMRSRSSRAASGPSPACAPTGRPGCSTPTGAAYPGPLCRRHRHGERHGRPLSRRRHQSRPGHDLRLHRRPHRRRRHRRESTCRRRHDPHRLARPSHRPRPRPAGGRAASPPAPATTASACG